MIWFIDDISSVQVQQYNRHRTHKPHTFSQGTTNGLCLLTMKFSSLNFRVSLELCITMPFPTYSTNYLVYISSAKNLEYFFDLSRTEPIVPDHRNLQKKHRMWFSSVDTRTLNSIFISQSIFRIPKLQQLEKIEYKIGYIYTPWRCYCFFKVERFLKYQLMHSHESRPRFIVVTFPINPEIPVMISLWIS